MKHKDPMLIKQAMHNSGTTQNSEEALYYKSRVERVKEYVSANLAADLSIGTVAKKSGMNKTTLRQVLKNISRKPTNMLKG